MIFYKNTNVKVHSPDGGILREDTLDPYLFIICRDYVLQTSIDLMKGNDFTLEKARSRL